MIRFIVDDVEPASDPLNEIPTDLALEPLVQELEDETLPLLAYSQVDMLVLCPSPSPFFWAIHKAYSEHRPLRLTPDALWLTIMQGVEQHISLHHEALRDRLVSHFGIRELSTQTDTLSNDSWAECLEALIARLEAETGELGRLSRCDFSTSGPVERIASGVVLMSAMRHYYSYAVRIICGIPEVELTGTAEDWLEVRRRVERLRGLDLDRWVDRLIPICDQLVATAQGQPDRAFWQHIYIPLYVYGGDLVLGWCAELCPYIRPHAMAAAATRPNPALELPTAERLALYQKALEDQAENGAGRGFGPFPHAFQLGLFPRAGSSAPITRSLEGYEWEAVAVGGVLGVRQEGLTLEPVACWAVREASPAVSLAEQLARRFGLTQTNEQPNLYSCPAALLQLYASLGHGALFGGRWLLNSPARWWPIALDREGHSAVVFGMLADGRVLCAGQLSWEDSEARYLVGRAVEPTEPRSGISYDPIAYELEDLVIIAMSTDELLMRLVAADGAYFMDTPRFRREALARLEAVHEP